MDKLKIFHPTNTKVLCFRSDYSHISSTSSKYGLNALQNCFTVPRRQSHLCMCGTLVLIVGLTKGILNNNTFSNSNGGDFLRRICFFLGCRTRYATIFPMGIQPGGTSSGFIGTNASKTSSLKNLRQLTFIKYLLKVNGSEHIYWVLGVAPTHLLGKFPQVL